MKKNQTKRNSKNLMYVVVMVSIAVASVLSIFSMKKKVMTSLDEENTQKIFSSNSETIVKKEEVNDANKKFIEKISFIREDETDDVKKDKTNNQKEVKQENEVTKKETDKLSDQKEEQKSKEIETSNQKEEQKSEENTQNNQKESTNNKKIQSKQEDYDNKEVFFQNKDSFIVPLCGDIEKDFSDNKLIYSKTLDEWRVHKGIDITSKEGASVKAVLDGYVEEIKNDEEYGMSVSIRHSKNLVSCYKSLSDDVLVLPNQIVKQGDIIGFVGNTSKIENSIGSHLHFEMMNKNKLVDPKIYIQFKK